MNSQQNNTSKTGKGKLSLSEISHYRYRDL